MTTNNSDLIRIKYSGWQTFNSILGSAKLELNQPLERMRDNMIEPLVVNCKSAFSYNGVISDAFVVIFEFTEIQQKKDS